MGLQKQHPNSIDITSCGPAKEKGLTCGVPFDSNCDGLIDFVSTKYFAHYYVFTVNKLYFFVINYSKVFVRVFLFRIQ